MIGPARAALILTNLGRISERINNPSGLPYYGVLRHIYSYTLIRRIISRKIDVFHNLGQFTSVRL
jgi:hypothetical protein